MFLGEYAHTIDDKNRLTLPAKFRDRLADGGVVTRGLDGCLYLFPRDGWDSLTEGRLAELDLLSREGRLMQRHFFSAAVDAEPDKQGGSCSRPRWSSTRSSGRTSSSRASTTTSRSGIAPPGASS